MLNGLNFDLKRTISSHRSGGIYKVKMLRRCFLIIIFLLPVLLKAQITSLKGTVVDSITGEKLPFVTVLVNDLTNQGISTDTRGNFKLKSAKPITSIKVSFVGYQTKKITFKATDKISTITVLLAPQQMQLEDVMVMSGENPA